MRDILELTIEGNLYRDFMKISLILEKIFKYCTAERGSFPL